MDSNPIDAPKPIDVNCRGDNGGGGDGPSPSPTPPYSDDNYECDSSTGNCYQSETGSMTLDECQNICKKDPSPHPDPNPCD